MERISLKKNYLYNLFYQILNLFVPFITAPYCSRVLGAENIGIYSFTASIVSYFTLFANLGLGVYGQREIAYARDDEFKTSIVFFEIFICKCFTVGISLVAFGIFIINYPHYKYIFIIQGINIVSVLFECSWLFQGKQDFKITVVRGICIRILGIVALFTFIHSKQDFTKYIILLTIVNFLSCLSLLICVPKYVKKVPLHVLHPFRNNKVIIELFIPFLAIQVYKVLDKTMLGIAGNLTESGCFEQTTKITSICMGGLTSLGTVLLPRMAKEYSEKNFEHIRHISEKAFAFISLISCPVCVGLICVSTNFIPFFLGKEYDRVIILLKIYSLVLVIIPLSNIAGNAVLIPINKHNYGTCAVICGAIVNFALNKCLIPLYAGIGAAVASVVAELLVTLLHFIFIRKYCSIKKIILTFIKYMFYSGCMYILIMVIMQVFFRNIASNFLITIIKIILGVVTYFLILIITKDNLFNEIIKRKKNETRD